VFYFECSKKDLNVPPSIEDVNERMNTLMQSLTYVCSSICPLQTIPGYSEEPNAAIRQLASAAQEGDMANLEQEVPSNAATSARGRKVEQ
jgi:hypothetical protein